MAELISDSANYKTITQYSSAYKFMNLQPTNIAQNSITLAPSATQQIDFQLPLNTVYNLSKSVLQWEVKFPAVVGMYTWLHEGSLPFQTISLDVGAVNIMNLQYAQQFHQLNKMMNTSYDELENQDPISGFYSSGKTKLPNYLPVSYVMPRNNAESLTPGTTFVADDAKEPQYLAVSSIPNAVYKRMYRFTLSDLMNTYVGMDVNSIFNQTTRLTLIMGMINRIAYNTPSALDPITGAAQIVGNTDIGNIQLRLALEVDPSINSSVKNKFATGGMEFQYPNVAIFRTPSAGQNININLNLNSTFGSMLKQIIHAVYSPTDGLNLTYDHSNVDGSKISSYNTFLNSLQIQTSGAVNCHISNVEIDQFNADDYLLVKRYLNKNQSLLSTYNLFQRHWFHLEAFYEPHNSLISSDRLDVGLSMAQPITYGIQMVATNNAALVHMTYCLFTKQLLTTPDSIVVK